MDSSRKQIGSSDVENDQQREAEKVDEDDDSIGTGRSYECAFCKRGFTNAQALGGHMNIHRKDKAKAKQLITRSPSSSPSTNKPSELDYTKCFSPISSTEREHHYYSTLGGQMNYQRYLPASNPSFPHAYRPNFEFPRVREDGDLRLGIGLPNMEEEEEKKEDDDEEKRSRKGNEVDLELRLGHSP